MTDRAKAGPSSIACVEGHGQRCKRTVQVDAISVALSLCLSPSSVSCHAYRDGGFSVVFTFAVMAVSMSFPGMSPALLSHSCQYTPNHHHQTSSSSEKERESVENLQVERDRPVERGTTSRTTSQPSAASPSTDTKAELVRSEALPSVTVCVDLLLPS